MKGIIRKYFRGTSSSSSPSSSFCCCRKVNPAQTTASTLVIEQLVVNSGGGGGNGLPANGLYRNGHHYNNGLHLHFAANNGDWFAMTAVQQQQPRTNGGLLLQAPLNTPQMVANGNGRNQPIVEYRNGRAVKFKMKNAPSSSGGGNNDSGTSTSGGADNKSSSKRSKKQSKGKYVYERNKWSRRSNASRGSSSGTGSSGGGKSANFNLPNQHPNNNFLTFEKTTGSVVTNR